MAINFLISGLPSSLHNIRQKCGFQYNEDDTAYAKHFQDSFYNDTETRSHVEGLAESPEHIARPQSLRRYSVRCGWTCWRLIRSVKERNLFC